MAADTTDIMPLVNEALMTPTESKWVGQLSQAIRNMPRSICVEIEEGGVVNVYKRFKLEPFNRHLRVATQKRGPIHPDYRPEGW